MLKVIRLALYWLPRLPRSFTVAFAVTMFAWLVMAAVVLNTGGRR